MAPTLTVAEKLLGQTLCVGEKRVIITETEAYIGRDDPACHAARGRTKRTETMFKAAGFSYVYLIYGMYHCLNIVTEKEDFPAAVLIRGGYSLEDEKHYDGPGKLCRHLGVTTEHNSLDMTESSYIYCEKTNVSLPFKNTPRIGISQGKDKLWRFVAAGKDLDDMVRGQKPEKRR